MTDDESTESVPTDRESPVGEPVIRGDPSLTGQQPEEAVRFDPEDKHSLDLAAETVDRFANHTADNADSVFMLRGAAACAALVRGTGSYRAAATSAGEEVPVSFIRKWARVHDLPESVRRHVAKGEIPPSSAKHIARLTDESRLHLAWAVLDHDLTVREVRAVASGVDNETDVETVLAQRGYSLGEITIELSPKEYCNLRRSASLGDTTPGVIVTAALTERFEES